MQRTVPKTGRSGHGRSVPAQHPPEARIRHGIPSVQRVPVHQLLHDRQRFGRMLAPFQYLLAPQHPHVAMEPAFRLQFLLCGVPDLVVRLGPVQCLEAVTAWARIARWCSSVSRAHAGSVSYPAKPGVHAEPLNASSRHTRSWSRNISADGETPHHPSRAPPAPRPSRRVVHRSWVTMAAKTSCADT